MSERSKDPPPVAGTQATIGYNAAWRSENMPTLVQAPGVAIAPPEPEAAPAPTPPPEPVIHRTRFSPQDRLDRDLSAKEVRDRDAAEEAAAKKQWWRDLFRWIGIGLLLMGMVGGFLLWILITILGSRHH